MTSKVQTVPFFGPSPKLPPLILVSVYDPEKSVLSVASTDAASDSTAERNKRNGSFMTQENYHMLSRISKNARSLLGTACLQCPKMCLATIQYHDKSIQMH